MFIAQLGHVIGAAVIGRGLCGARLRLFGELLFVGVEIAGGLFRADGSVAILENAVLEVTGFLGPAVSFLFLLPGGGDRFIFVLQHKSAVFATADGSGIVDDFKPGTSVPIPADASHPISAGDALVIYSPVSVQ